MSFARGWTASLVAVWALASPLLAEDWTNWRGPGARGVSPEKGLPKTWDPEKAGENNLVWKRDVGSRSTPLVMKGRVYLLNYAIERVKAGAELKDRPETIQERVMCFDADTGKTIWEHQFPIFHTDIVTVRLGWTNMTADPETGFLYCHGTQGSLICFDVNGDQPKVVWQRSLTEEFGRITGYGGRVTSPIVFEDLLILGMLNSSWGDQAKGANRFVAFDKKTGAVRWWADPLGGVKDTYYSVPVIARMQGEDLMISGGADGSVVALRARTGEKVWAYQFGTTAVNCSPVVDGTLVYIGHGEENPDNNIQGRVVCVDGAKVTDGKPALVWQVDGLKARYTSPIFDSGKLYITDEIGKLYCLDGKTGKQLWKYSYGRNARGSPVLADGKIYVGEVNSKFHIIDVTGAKPKNLHSQFFAAVEGTADVEINGSASVANGRVYFATSDEFFCIGEKRAGGKSEAVTDATPAPGAADALAIVPADITLHAGETAKFSLQAFSKGFAVATPAGATWSLPTPALPPGAKTAPPPLDGTVTDGTLTVDAKKAAQHGYVEAKVGNLVARARVRVVAKVPYMQDFSKIPDGAAPAGWVNAQGKFVVKTVDGEKVLAKVNDKASPLIARGNAFITLPTATGYTIESDVFGTKKGEDLPDFGVVANRYTLMLAGNAQKLRLVSWDALPRVDTTIAYKVEPGVWYRMKLSVVGEKIQGKVWKRGEAEPAAWTVTLTDPRPIREGSAALYGYVTGILEGATGNDIYYDNLRIAPNK